MYQSRVNKIVIHFIFMIVCLACLVPFLTIISISVSDEALLINSGYSILPRGIDFKAYRYIFKTGGLILHSYLISYVVTFVGAMVNMLMTILYAYPLCRPFRYRKAMGAFLFIAIVFNGGLVPTYILMVKYLKMTNTIWAHVMSFALFPFFIIILRTYFHQIPDSLIESAKIDGAGEFSILLRIIMPLAKPGIAVIALLSLLRYWNDTWWTGMLYITDQALITLPQLLQRLMTNITFLLTGVTIGIKVDIRQVPTESARMAMCVLAVGPMLLIFPFFQKYFVRGMTIGAIKG